jgi:hypothetical protein
MEGPVMTRQGLWRTCAAALEIFANVAIVGLAVLVVGMFVHARVSRSAQSAAPAVVSTPPYRAGEILSEKLDGVPLAAKPETMLVVVQSRCKFCTASMPFYERLSKTAHARTQIVVLTQEEAAIGHAYVSSHGFEPDAVVSIPEFARIHSTPTVILTDATKTVRQIWTGKLSAASEAEVLAALNTKR